MTDRLRRTLPAAAAVYFALLPSATLTFWRSLAFAVAAVLTAAVVARRRHARPVVPLPGSALPLLTLAWVAWTLASILWSVDTAYSAAEWRGDVLWGVATLAIFYVAAGTQGGFALLAATALGTYAFWTGLAVGLALSPIGWDARPFHRGDGAFATYLVTTAPLLLLLVWPAPVGLRTGMRSLIAGALLLALLVVAVRLSENRIAWIALAAGVTTAIACAPATTRTRSTAAAIALVIACSFLFLDAARDRAASVYGPHTTVEGTLKADPRLAIWKHAAERIRERPWLGHGYGLHILGERIGAGMGNPTIRHPHNMFAGQWLQTGAIGLALFVAMLAAWGWQFLRCVRTSDPALRRLGAIGLAVMIAFIVRNLTDDFFLRANGRLLFAIAAMLLGAAVARQRGLPAPAA
jgi:O-antigen ligase